MTERRAPATKMSFDVSRGERALGLSYVERSRIGLLPQPELPGPFAQFRAHWHPLLRATASSSGRHGAGELGCRRSSHAPATGRRDPSCPKLAAPPLAPPRLLWRLQHPDVWLAPSASSSIVERSVAAVQAFRAKSDCARRPRDARRVVKPRVLGPLDVELRLRSSSSREAGSCCPAGAALRASS